MDGSADYAAGLRAWARRAGAHGLSDMKQALMQAANEVERLQDVVRVMVAERERNQRKAPPR